MFARENVGTNKERKTKYWKECIFLYDEDAKDARKWRSNHNWQGTQRKLAKVNKDYQERYEIVSKDWKSIWGT